MQSPSPENLRSNPHPYAIKTTATGLLSRSNSSHSAASAPHHYVPSSPTKHQSTHPRPTSHRYSSSLTANDLPRPLPVPPPFDPPADRPVLYRVRDRRADTLPSAASQPLLFGTDHLPGDPRTWSPSDLSAYLSSSLRATSPDLPALDIAAFVRAQNISGKAFLRLTDGDLDNYGLNQRWLDALLRASRVLRQNSIRDRIWNTSAWEDDNTYSSTSSSSSLNGKSRLSVRKTPWLTLLIVDTQRTESGASGRVKGMIASFERSSSPTKSLSNRRSISPVKSLSPEDTRPPRPQSDTYPMDSSSKEPRLLPYPPSPAPTPNAYGPPPLLPHAFPSGALPFSPQSTGTSPLIPSPPPQPFSDVFYTDPNTRPLPFPPHVGQYYPPIGAGYDEDGMTTTGMPPPRGMMALSEPKGSSPTRKLTVPDVRHERGHAVDTGASLLRPAPHSMEALHHHPVPFSPEILSPQPRESPTKELEEKLEELLEPRPRSRVLSHHSRVVSGGGGSMGSSSRPRSRVASVTASSANGSWGRKHQQPGSRAGTPGIVEERGGVRLAFGDDDDGDEHDGGVCVGDEQPRTRVISISRAHSHRLSGVEVWGETHPGHYHRGHHHHHHLKKKRLGIPFGGDEEEEGVVDDDDNGGARVEGVKDETGSSSSEDGEIGNIESVLEKSESLVDAAGGATVEDHGVPVAREPKRSVITVLEGPCEPAKEESVEALLVKERGGGGSLSGAEAWEMVGGVETVKRVGGGGEGKRCFGEVFEDVEGGARGVVCPTSPDVGEGKRSGVDERELERLVGETREMVEDVKSRLRNVEVWIENREKDMLKKRHLEKDGGVVMRILKGLSTLFYPYHHHPTSSSANTATTTTSKRKRVVGLGLGLGLSSCVVLFGIGVCMVLLRVLGRRPGGGGGLGLGRMVGHWAVLKAGAGARGT